MGIPVFQHPWHTLCFAAPLSHWTLKQETLNCSVLSPNLPNQNHQSCQIDNLIQRVEQHIHKCHDLNQKDNKCCPIIFQPNDRVDLWKPLDFLHPERGRKYARHWSGPYVVVEHCWEKPWRVTIRELLVLGRSQSVLITSDFTAGILSQTNLQNFGPHLPLLYNGLTSRKVIMTDG